MALLFVDSFDHYASGNITQKWTSGAANIGATGRNGSNGMSGPSALYKSLGNVGDATCVIGVAVQPTLTDTFECISITNGDIATAVQLTLITKADGSIQVKRGTLGTGTILDTSSAGILSTGTHFYIEIKAKIDNATGTVEVRVNGSAVLTLAGIDTQNLSVSSWNTVRLGNAGDGYDDLYICDGTGAACNDFLGDCRVECLYAQAGNGANTGFTPSTGSDHGAMVDDITPNGDTDYNSAVAAGLKDTYNMSNLAGTGAIQGLQVVGYVRKADSTLKQVATVVRHSGTDYVGSTQTVGLSYLFYRQVYMTNPGTGVAWTIANVNAMEAGLQVIA